MTHLPFIVASYALAAAVLAGFGVAAWQRLASAQRKLTEIDSRRQPKGTR